MYGHCGRCVEEAGTLIVIRREVCVVRWESGEWYEVRGEGGIGNFIG